MKKLWRIYHGKHMLRPTVYRTVAKVAAVLALSLLWDRFLNRDGPFGIGYAFTVLGLVCLALSWFSYLSLDGVEIHHLLERDNPKKKKHIQRDMVDYVEESVVSFDELEPEEQSACRLASFLVTGAAFLLLGVLMA